MVVQLFTELASGQISPESLPRSCDIITELRGSYSEDTDPRVILRSFLLAERERLIPKGMSEDKLRRLIFVSPEFEFSRVRLPTDADGGTPEMRGATTGKYVLVAFLGVVAGPSAIVPIEESEEGLTIDFDGIRVGVTGEILLSYAIARKGRK